MNKNLFHSIYISAHNNAISLLRESNMLYNNKDYSRSYFLAFTALEELSKSQLAADVYTDFITEKYFFQCFRHHNKKIERIDWSYLDATEQSPNEFWEYIETYKPEINKRMESLYVGLNESKDKIICPNDSISKEDSESIINIVESAIHKITVKTEYSGEQIGTKGFMK